MTKTTMLMAVMTLVCSGAAAQAQVYTQPAYYPYSGNAYTVSQPVYAPANYNQAAYSQPVYTGPAYTAPAYAAPAYTGPAYTPTTAYYAGSSCGQVVPCSYSCSSPCACSPCTTTYAAASPCVPQAVYAPVTYAPAPAPCACGPQACIRRGLLGQPTVYVPGQPVRNFFRYLTL